MINIFFFSRPNFPSFHLASRCVRAVLVLVFVVYSRRRESHIKYPGPDDDVRENIINYDDEGGGEDDMTAFDITPLQIPIGGPMPELTQCKMPPIMCKCCEFLICNYTFKHRGEKIFKSPHGFRCRDLMKFTINCGFFRLFISAVSVR